MLEPKISVIVPVFNSYNLLRKCLDSIRFQTYSNLEVICVNDGSTDESLSVLEEYKAVDQRFVIINQDNQGTGQARNNGLDAATGDYISFVDSDDWLLLNLYQTFIDDLNKLNSSLDIYMFNARQYSTCENDIFPANTLELADWNFHKSKYSIHTFDDCQKPFTRNLAVYNKIFNRNFIVGNKIKFPKNLKYEDMAFCIESCLYAKSIILNGEVFYRYRLEETGTASTEVVPKVFDIFRIVDLIENNILKFKLYESLKYALFQFKYNVFVRYYKYCPEHLKESYYNEMRFRLLSAETQDLDKKIASHLRDYELFLKVKNSTRKIFDNYYKNLH